MASKSKFFCIATEGATTDGRQIVRDWITQMAKNFDPKKYGARVWLEHLRGTLPDSPFRAYGDVLALKAEEVEMDGAKKLGLFAQIEPTADLVAMVKARQKIYTSMEVREKFADTGEAYLVGLGVTDSPASLGTDVLTFAQQNPAKNPFSSRKTHPDNLFSAAVEVQLEFDETAPDDGKLSAKVRELLGRFTAKKTGDDARFNDVNEAVELMMNHISEGDKKFSAAIERIDKLQTDLNATTAAFNSLKQQLDTEDGKQAPRPPANGGSGELQTDC